MTNTPVPNATRTLSAIKKKVAEDNKARYKESSKDRLNKIAEKKLRTAFIGALAKFEESFGFLWGHEQETELSPEQIQMAELWDHCRTEVLNNGNNQIRALKKEVDNQTISWDRHSMTLPVKPLTPHSD